MAADPRVAIVTGAGQGIGAAIARRLSASGNHVVIFDINEEKAQETAAAIRQGGGQAVAYRVDVTKSQEVEEAVRKVLDEYGQIHVLVNNVGIIRDNYLTKMPEEDWDIVLETNLKSYFLCCRAVVRDAMMPQKYGRIVNISSRSWLGNVGQVNYSAAKAGIVGLTRTLARELGKFNITVNCVAPGVIDTPMYRSLRPDIQQRLLSSQPIQRIGQPEDVAYAVDFFARDEAWYLTGQVLYVCGGKSLSSY